MWQAQQIAAIQIANQMLYAMSAPSSYSLSQRPPHLAQHAMVEDNAADTDDEDDEQLRTLFVGNLDDRVTEDLLYEVFLQAGPVEAVRIPKDNSGRQRSFGFVVYSHRCTPPYAIRLFAGLAFYRKMVTIKLQEDPNASNKRRSLPTDCERYTPRPGDNNMLRSTSYPSFYDPSLNENNNSTQFSNPFRTNSPDWTKGNSGRGRDRGGRERERDVDNDRGARHSNSHSRSHPYKRDERRQRR
ncbi:RNA-binding protein 7-like [Rhagoletis pomonella]|uniref:RNA-binding protein 7-like n=1 Tax=Rhagoletis pomonella TaxID=28610 RepID=UPI0017858659|nr:RNA-binding protein 7-like [Rhagoletis pomonella]XP_036342416.1 RNA-binding protein 7-like [Rhagoletis pomonella]